MSPQMGQRQSSRQLIKLGHSDLEYLAANTKTLIKAASLMQSIRNSLGVDSDCHRREQPIHRVS